MEASLPRLLFCDYDGEFQYAETLSRLGFLVDQIRPDGLRAVAVGDHSAYVFIFESDSNLEPVKKICRKLKSAELLTPIVVVGLSPSSKEARFEYADHVLLQPESESVLLDTLDELMGTPPPYFLRNSSTELPTIEVDSSFQDSSQKLKELESEVLKLRESAESANKALEAQRNFYKPKLKALLEGGQKVDQHNQEYERLRVKLSEVEARLLEREARIKELEQMRQTHKAKLDQLLESHQKAQQSLRSFYQEKIRLLSPKSAEEATKS